MTQMRTRSKTLEREELCRDSAPRLLELPEEVLDVIWSEFDDSLGDRRALRLVCTRSRALVDKSVTRIRVFGGDDVPTQDRDSDYHRALSQVPWQLEELTFVGFGVCEKSLAGVMAGAGRWAGTLRVLRLGVGAMVDTREFVAHAWPRLRVLSLNNTRLSGGLRPLAGAELPSLWSLDLGSCELSADDIRGFARQAKLPALRLLRLANNGLGLDGAEALTKAAWPDLEDLNLDKCGLESKGAALLAKGAWPKLRLLSLVLNQIGPDGGLSLAQAEFPLLEELHLDCNNLGDQGIGWLAAGRWPSLDTLDVGGNELSAAGAAAIAAAPHWGRLRHLHIAHNDLGDDGAAALTAGRWPYLQSLLLNGTCLSSEGVAALGRWTTLRTLRLDYNDLGAEGAAELARLQWPSLEHLSLTNSGLGAEGAAALARAQLPRLQSLTMDLHGVGAAGLAALASASWPCLASFVVTSLVSKEDLSEEGFAALAARWPGLEVDYCLLNKFCA